MTLLQQNETVVSGTLLAYYIGRSEVVYRDLNRKSAWPSSIGVLLRLRGYIAQHAHEFGGWVDLFICVSLKK